MPISDFLTEPCVLLRDEPSAVDDDGYGNALHDETRETTVCSLQLHIQRSDEPQDDVSDQNWRLFLPAATILDTGDAVEVAGLRYELVGAPWTVIDPRTRVASHVECRLRRTAGSEDRT